MENLIEFEIHHKNNPVLITFVYPGAVEYIDFLIFNLNNQSDLNYCVLFFNDGVKHLEHYLKEIRVPYFIYDIQGLNPKEIRFKGLELLKALSFKKIIFQDSDDGLSTNRIEVTSKLLDSFPLVVNDLDLMNDKGDVFKKNIWKNRFNQKNEFYHRDISCSNFVGLGNTSIRKELLNYLPKCPQSNIIAVDWFLFYVLLKNSNSLAYRTSLCKSMYRQHESNTVGLKKASNEFINKVKKLHQRALNEVGITLFLDQKSDSNKNNYNTSELFWWETI